MRAWLLVIALTFASTGAHGAALVEIPALNGIAFEFVWKISGDGQVLVGNCSTPTASFVPCRWSAASGYVLLEMPPDVPSYYDGPFGTTYDGAFVFGVPGGSRPARWNANGQIEYLPGFPTDESVSVYDVSADGSVVVGQLGFRAFRWTAPGQLTIHPEGRIASAVSADGSVSAVCCSQTGLPGLQEGRAFLWRADGSMRILPRLHRYSYELPGGMSGDGRYVLLSRDPGVDLYGFAWRWSEKRGQELLARPRRHDMFLPVFFDASMDGSTAVGTTERYEGESLVWDAPHGARRLFDVLVERGVDVGPWDGVMSTTSISDDGLRMPARVKSGTQPGPYYVAVLAPACSDGVDNDGDGAVDGADVECASPSDDSESLETGGARAPLGFLLALVPLAFVRRRSLAIAAASILLPAAAGAAGVTPIEPQNGVVFGASAMSGDARVLAGFCREGSAPARPCRWRLASGPEWMAGDASSGISDLSGDGSIVVGSRPFGMSGQAVRWLANGEREDLLPPIPDPFVGFVRALHVSPDGSVIVGQAYVGGVMRWTQAGGAEYVPLASGALGWNLFTGNDSAGAFVFAFGGAPTPLPALDAETPFAGSAATPDGAVIAASGEWFSPRIPVWRAATGLERLAPPEYPFFLQPWVRAISDDASTIVGEDEVAGAFVWQAESGLMRLGDYLAVRHQVATPEWDFENVLDLSADGRTMLVRGYRNGALADALVSLAPACDDGLDNDADGAVDMADPQCLTPDQRAERRACGLGFEIAFAIAPLALARARRRATRTRP